MIRYYATEKHLTVTCCLSAACQPSGTALREQIVTTPRVGGCSFYVATFEEFFANSSDLNVCPAGNCDCATPNLIYGVQCGSLLAAVSFNLDLDMTLSGASMDTYLTNLGIGNVNTIHGMLSVTLRGSVPVTWSIDVWRRLEVVRGPPGDVAELNWCP